MGQAVWTIRRLELAKGGQDQKRDGLMLLRFYSYRWHLHVTSFSLNFLIRETGVMITVPTSVENCYEEQIN